jgi:hypothetical protein
VTCVRFLETSTGQNARDRVVHGCFTRLYLRKNSSTFILSIDTGGFVNGGISAFPVRRRDRQFRRVSESAGCEKKPLRIAETLDKLAHPRTVDFAFNAARS